MSLPPTPEARDEVDDLYRQASAVDPSRPAEAVRRRVLEHATQLAAERSSRPAPASARARAVPQRSSRWWRSAAMFGTLAAAAVAGLMIAPRFIMSPRAPTLLPPVVTAVQPALETAPFSREDKAAAPPPAPAEPAPVAPPRPAAYAGQSRQRGEPTQERMEAQSGAVAAAAPPASADASAAANTDMAAGLAQQQVTVTGSRRAAMAPAAANVIDAAAAFRQAAAGGDLRAVDRLLAGQSDINARDAAGRTPLMLAILHGQTEVVSALLAYGADPNAADSHGTTPLEAARASGRPAIIAALQRYGAQR